MRLLILILSLAIGASSASAQAWRGSVGPAIACPADAGDTAPPDFTAPDCEPVQVWRLDPQGRDLWIRATVSGEDIQDGIDGPIGLHIAAKASSTVWLNGALLGANGRPGPDHATERPGRMSAVIFVPRDRIRRGANALDMRLSSHHGLITLARPIHWISFGAYTDPTRSMLSRYAPSLLMLSLFVAGFAVFAVSTWRGPRRELSAINAAVAFFAAAQLGAEVSRGIFAYPYPVHDLRLIAIALFSVLFSTCLLSHLTTRLTGWSARWRYGASAGFAVILTVCAWMSPTFDAKTALVLLTVSATGVLVSVYAVWRGRREAWAYGAGLSLAGGLALVRPSAFLDQDFYYLSAALISVLLIEQAFALARERRNRLAEAARAQGLAAALARAEQAARPARLALPSAGRTEYVSSHEIAQLRGAGDYVELVFTDGRTALVTTTLARLEDDLPVTFLRVHRSAIVNTDLAERLEREPGGAGRLILKGGAEAPVSRRILPKVKAALNP